MGFNQARQILAESESLISGSEYEVNSQQVLEPVRDSNCSTHDCEFAALAMQLSVKTVTMDGKLLTAYPKLAIPLPAARRPR